MNRKNEAEPNGTAHSVAGRLFRTFLLLIGKKIKISSLLSFPRSVSVVYFEILQLIYFAIEN